jgi:hypothetical protein
MPLLKKNESKIFNIEQKEFIKNINIPFKFTIITDSIFDSKVIFTEDDKWIISIGGERVSFNFLTFDIYSKKLFKYLIMIINQRNGFPSPTQFDSYKKLFYMKFSFECHEDSLKNLAREILESSHRLYYDIKRITRLLCQIDFPHFSMDKLETLDFLITPNSNNYWLKYQDIENSFPSYFKNQISRSIVINSKKVDELNEEALQNYSILGISFFIGLRAIQFSKLAANNLILDTSNPETKLTRYSLLIPYAKRTFIDVDQYYISIPNELGILLSTYISRFKISKNEQLFHFKKGIRKGIFNAINNALIDMQSTETKKLIQSGEIIPPHYTAYDMRHNVGHSMAMSGASADEIAYVLGHSSTVAASHYIMATPELAMLKNKALGNNVIWKNMIGLMLTGSQVSEKLWKGRTVSGIVGDQLFIKVGGCSREANECYLSKVRSCYGCFYFRPFSNLEKHQNVLKSIDEELINIIEISDKTGNSKNPAINVIINTKAEIQIVINRIENRCN